MLTVEQRIFLSRSKEFQKLLNDDPYLDELNRSRYDHAAEFASLSEIFGIPLKIGSLIVRPLTPALWAFLWGIGNTYTGDVEKITESDTDVFLYLISREKLDFKPDEISSIPVKAHGWCAKFGIGYPEAAVALIGMIHRAFRPLEMLPKVEASADYPSFDADWLTRLCCTVANESGNPLEHVMYSMPLSLVYWCFVNHLRKNDDKGFIRKRSNDEVSREIVLYVDSLGERFIREHFPETKKPGI